MNGNYKENRPWGNFENLLDNKDCKVKKIIIEPGQSPSYQYHLKREEVWVIVKGIGEFKLDEQIMHVKERDILYIPVKSKHQLKNIGDEKLEFIEIQLGEYFGEDDIVRISDIYGRL